MKNKTLIYVSLFLVLGIILFFLKLKNSNSCNYNSKNYRESENFDAVDGCNTCSCNNGEVVCTLMACFNPK